MSFLRNIIILVAVLIAATNISFAKNYSLVPNDTILINGLLEDLQTLTIQQLNTSKDTINLQWKKLKADMPENWEASVCDNSFCYTSLVENGTMLPVFPDDYGMVLLHVTPKINYGEALIQYAVWDAKFPNEIDTLTYILIAEKATSIKSEYTSNIEIFPNPTNNILNISNNSIDLNSYYIRDIFSRIVLTGQLNSNINQVALQSLASGFYSIEIKDRNGKVKSIHSFIKN